MARGQNTAYHPARQVGRPRFATNYGFVANVTASPTVSAGGTAVTPPKPTVQVASSSGSVGSATGTVGNSGSTGNSGTVGSSTGTVAGGTPSVDRPGGSARAPANMLQQGAGYNRPPGSQATAQRPK